MKRVGAARICIAKYMYAEFTSTRPTDTDVSGPSGSSPFGFGMMNVSGFW